MAIIPFAFYRAEHHLQGLIDTGLLAVWYSTFAVPVAFLVGVPTYHFLQHSGWLNTGSVCLVGLVAGLLTIVVLYGTSAQSVPFGFLALGGFGGLVAGGVSGLIIMRRSSNTVDPDPRESGTRGSP